MLLYAWISSAGAASPVWTVAPFGVGVYLHKRPLRGVLYTATQAGGIATWCGATWPARYAVTDGDEAAYARWQGVLVGAATVTIASYILAVIDGGRLHELEVEASKVAWEPRPGLPDVALAPDLRFRPAAAPLPSPEAPTGVRDVHRP